ncbi:hypothetical protein AABB24_005371 [Solanum stoloniferum]|uniref:Uncharacterized protein n=2 Tax=Solanum TaxID=4107 RepID=A0AAF0QB16_SOLVR|nr:uncharacterized protein LOC125808400 [Solanum verrucosum]WMV19951.1 hypothetical protein MTR67_013336 [Solanum verrucosum]
MASFLPHVKTHFLIPNSNISAIHNLQIPSDYGKYIDSNQLRQPLLSSKCGKGDSIERKLLDEQIDKLGRMSSKCKEVAGGMVELLECLEREAIMGDDEGKAPMDYNRRAQIFDKSSTVFQALKETTTTYND